MAKTNINQQKSLEYVYQPLLNLFQHTEANNICYVLTFLPNQKKSESFFKKYPQSQFKLVKTSLKIKMYLMCKCKCFQKCLAYMGKLFGEQIMKFAF